jgi:NAD(P)H dehydrogenase (quinone)
MAPKCDVAVIGASGATGKALVGALRRRRLSVRALTRNPPRDAISEDGVEYVAAELADPSSLSNALIGADRVYYIPPVFCADEERFAHNLIAAAVASKVTHLVYHSVLHAPTPAMPHHARKAAVELMLRESSLVWTILQPAMYAQTTLIFLDRQRRTLSPAFDTERLFTPVDLNDLAEAIASVVVEPIHAFATYELAGAQTLSFADMASTLSKVLGHSVTLAPSRKDVIVDQFAIARGFGPSAKRDFTAMLEYYDRHGLIGNGNILQMLLKRPATPYADVVRRELTTAS